MHEMAAVSSLPAHCNIVAYYRAWQQNAHFYIQMQLCEGGSLADLLEKVQFPPTPHTFSQTHTAAY